MKKSRFAAAVLSVLMAVGVLLMVFSLIGIFRPINETDPKPGDRTEIEPELGIPVYTRKNPITGGEEYYYAVFSLYGSPKGWIVRADKDYAELFDPDSGRAQTLIFSRGTMKKFGVPQEMRSIERDIDGFILNSVGECDFEYDTFIDLTARERFVFTLKVGAVCAAAGVIPLAVLTIKRRLAERSAYEEKGE